MSGIHVQGESGPSGPLSRFLRLAEWVEETLIAYLLAAMTIVAFANVIVRRVFGGSLIWALELTLNLFLYLVLFGMAYVLRKGVHIGVDVIVNLFPRAAQRWINVVASATLLSATSGPSSPSACCRSASDCSSMSADWSKSPRLM